MRQRLLISATLITLLCVTGLSLYFSNRESGHVQQISCPLASQACEFETTFGSAKFTLLPQPPSSKEGINLELQLSDQQPEKVWVDLQGKEMYMGVNQTNLQLENGSWAAPATLGVCTTGEMLWELTLILEHLQQQDIYRFEFSAR